MKTLVLNANQLIKNANDNIERNIELLCPEHAGLCAQNILSQSRNLIDAVALLQFSIDNPNFAPANGYDYVTSAIKSLNQKGSQFKPFIKLYDYLQVVASHYTQDQFNSEALLIKYSNLLFDIKNAVKDIYDIDILRNIDDFPFVDRREEEYYQAVRELSKSLSYNSAGLKNTYYIVKKVRRKFGLFEYVLSPANDKRTKFDRLTAYALSNINDSHSFECRFVKKELSYKGITTEVFFITEWGVSIRPCELNKLAKIQNFDLSINRKSPGYASLMNRLSFFNCSLFEYINSENFEKDIENILKLNNKLGLFLKLTKHNINKEEVGCKTIRYLLFTCKHEIMKRQIARDSEAALGQTMLDQGCFAFDSKPFSMSLKKHNPRLEDLLECLPSFCTNEELLKRAIVVNTEDRKMLYTPLKELNKYFVAGPLIEVFNNQLNEKMKHCSIETFDGYAYIKSYEEHTLSILKALKAKESEGDSSYTSSADEYISTLLDGEIDEEKIQILRTGFRDSSVLLINGAAGTGKTTLIKHFSNIFKNENILFLSCTNSSVQNLKIKVGNSVNHQFLTLEKCQHRLANNPTLFAKYTVLVIDECSMAENEVVDYIINHNHFKKMLLVGDERQIESIKFGNWFGISNKIFQSKFELTFNHRTTKPNLRLMWDLVRDLDEQDKIYEKFISGGFHHELDEHIFDKQSDDEIILCLNYDGLYGINNINKYLQRKNKGISVSWKVWTFKVGDRILFNESYYFRDYFYNNQKGRIENIKEFEDKVIFLVSINHESTNNRNSVSHVEWLQEKDNKDYYEITIDKDDDDDEEENSKKVLVVPFQLGYAISIHKSQGLEYDSVKVVMTKEVEEQISHNIFYTAITRAKEHLSIYCDKTSLEHIIKSFQKQTCEKDAIIIKRKYGL